MSSQKLQTFLGIQEIPFKKGQDWETGLIGAIVRGSDLEAVISGKVTIDGYEATDEIIKMVNSSKHKPQIKGIFLKGISVAGFNVIDIQRVYDQTNIPVVVCVVRLPELDKIEAALTKIGQLDKLELYSRNHEIYSRIPISGTSLNGSVEQNNKIPFLQSIGLDKDSVKALMIATCTRSQFPEPIRIVKIITQGLNPHLSTKPAQVKKKCYDPEKELRDIIENYNSSHSITAEEQANSDDLMIIADWIAKSDRAIQPSIERLINILSLAEVVNST